MTSESDIDAARWASVQARDKEADGQFTYAVKTTGVFCRPSCPAKPAKRKNVTFFGTASDAAAAGYRPCRRCHPLAVIGRDAQQTSLMEAMAAYIVAHAGEVLPLARLADQAGMSPFHFQRSFTAVTGVSPKQFQAAERLRAFKGRLRDGKSVLSAIFDAGYGSTSRVYEQVAGGLGMTPSAYRDGGAGETIVHAVRDTALGLLMMAATERGVCSIQLGSDESVMTAALVEEVPHALIERDDESLEELAVVLAGAVRGEPGAMRLPLDVEGTAFQIRVWEALRSIPVGETLTYAQVAAAIGAPRAVRAVGSACGANAVALAVPCHRVVRSDGSLGGYRWGVEKKSALLRAEQERSVS